MEREPVTVPVFLVLRRKQRADALPGGSANRLAAFPGGAGCPDKPSVRHLVNSGADCRTPGGTLGGRGCTMLRRSGVSRASSSGEGR